MSLGLAVLRHGAVRVREEFHHLAHKERCNGLLVYIKMSIIMPTLSYWKEVNTLPVL